jgi:hypothetical protein
MKGRIDGIRAASAGRDHRTLGFVFGANGVPMMRTGAIIGCSTRVAAWLALAAGGLVSKVLTAAANTTQNNATNASNSRS